MSNAVKINLLRLGIVGLGIGLAFVTVFWGLPPKSGFPGKSILLIPLPLLLLFLGLPIELWVIVAVGQFPVLALITCWAMTRVSPGKLTMWLLGGHLFFSAIAFVVCLMIYR